MKAIAIDGYGFENVVLRELDDPSPGPGEVRVRLQAAALNRLDLWTLGGTLGIEHDFPHVLGADGAGEIDALGEGVKAPKPGTPVIVNPGLSCGRCELCRAGEQSECPRFAMLGEHVPGTFAEYVVVPATNVFPAPGHLSPTEAAALGVTFLTAYRMLFVKGRMRPGEWVLITGIGGGLAVSLFQLARLVAGRVYVTSSSDAKIEKARSLGADGGVNYATAKVGREIRSLTGNRGVDLVVDSAGGASLDESLKTLRKGGRLVNAGATAGGKAEINLQRLFWNQIEVIGSTMGSDGDVGDMLRMVAGTGLKPIVDRVVPFAEGVQALRDLESEDRFGKIVLAM
jgi:NADPH:quinone reductase-like Zn-dependent oxidoreductase